MCGYIDEENSFELVVMKLTILFILISVCAFGQSAYKQIADHSKTLKPTIEFDALNGAYIQDADNAAKYLHLADSIKWSIVRIMFQIKKIDLALVSQHPDSLKITPAGISYILRKPKK